MTDTIEATSTRSRYDWATRGDVNAFFGLTLDNIGDMILMTSLLTGVYGLPRDFVLTRMIPGTAIGVLVGDLIFTALAFARARRSRNPNVTAMPLGLDTPSTFGMVFLVIGPAFAEATGRGLAPEAAARHAWFVAIAMTLVAGLFKLACAPFCGWIRRSLPRAGLLGSLTAIALVIISFLPLLEVVASPPVGLAALAVILATLTARWELPGKIPGALAAVVIGAAIYYGMKAILGDAATGPAEAPVPWSLRFALPLPASDWLRWLSANGADAARYLPVALPLTLATVVGGIDCAESASAAGDDYPTGAIIAADGLATLAGGAFGGVIQSTPYIGHPAYKAMGARAAYTLATALFIGGAGMFGYFGGIFQLLPRATVFPILIFVGLEITAQSFRATPRRHYPALALACVPALAYLAWLILNQLFGAANKPFNQYSPATQVWIQTITTLSGGFIVTSLIWGTALARLIDGKAKAAAGAFALAALASLFGVIHSPLAGGPIVSPTRARQLLEAQGRWAATAEQTPYHWAAGYLAMAALVLVIGRFGRQHPEESTTDD